MNATWNSRISPLDATAAEPFYRQIYDRFRTAIANGLLKPGDRIPSARALTKELGLARGTIEAAYSLLAAEGYIHARGQAGTIVTPGLTPQIPMAGAAMPHPRHADRPLAVTRTGVYRRDADWRFQLKISRPGRRVGSRVAGWRR